MLRGRNHFTTGPALPMARLALCALLLAAIPAHAQAVVGYRDAVESAMRCIHAAMTDALLPVGIIPEQIAGAALARCYDEIEAATSAAVANSDTPAAKAGFARALLRKELFDYALQMSGVAYRQASYVEATLVNASAEAAFLAPQQGD
jgi:hypothetical protein